MKFTFIDLFAGIGGMRLAFERNGGKCVFSSEWDRFSQQTYKENFGETPNGDITQIDARDIPKFDVLLAGFPCQPFSNIGKRQGFEHPTQGTLFFDVVRILEAKKPKAFLLENVPGLLTSDNGRTFQIIQDELRRIGYEFKHDVLDAADFGLPQVRKRLFIVGFRKEIYSQEFKFPISTVKKKCIGECLEENPTGYSITEKTQNNYLFKLDDGRPQVIDKNSMIQVKTLVASYHKIQRLTGTFVKGGETGLRLLSELECKRIMGFPEDYKIPVSRTQMYRQFGNSVAVPVVQAISKQMVQYLKENDREPTVQQLTIEQALA